MRVLIMAGGTGGHIFPGIAIAEQLQRQGVKVHWLGTARGLESQLVPQAQIPISYLTVSAWRGKGWRKQCLAPWQLLRACLQASVLLRKLKPDVVIGLGGFASGPGGLATWLWRIPLVIHEQNAVAGMTNRWLAKWARAVFTAFPDTAGLPTAAVWVGNPLRKALLQVPTFSLSLHRPLHVLVIGGSQGAHILNETVPQSIALLAPAERPEIWHQTGKLQVEVTRALYQSCNIDARVDPFIDDMAQAYGWADLVIARAGALTVSELACVGRASILIPFPHAVDDHQTLNAQYLATQRASILIPQSELSASGLGHYLHELHHHRQQLADMAQSAFGLRKLQAAEHVATQVMTLATEQK